MRLLQYKTMPYEMLLKYIYAKNKFCLCMTLWEYC